ncbi:hypothetical protein HanPI659440_Chr16g0660531 [Helianthus annuus]|nr:hypothetical protein HanHA89_Chr16g0685571 [Helianthus annuus]KAJ0683640.1 hypothetical protein HanPI659440_Chr16g0660531 [Helianthus annuus]
MMVMQMQMGSSSLDQENKIGFMGYNDQEDDSFSSDVSSVVSSDDESDDAFEESNSSLDNNSHALGSMSDLLQQLPSKRGLSKHFQGKSQSFTSLSKVTCLEDLAKPENPYNKKIKSCKSYAVLSRSLLPPPTRSASSSKLFTKATRASCSSLSNSSRPPTHPSHTNGATSASGFSNQTPLFV